MGIQDFEGLRTDGFVYVDKTQFIYRLVTEGNPYFLGRPRRFGKSLLLSTIKAYFMGKKELFTGLAMAELEKDWIEYPVFHIDLNVANYTGVDILKLALGANLEPLEEKWDLEKKDEPPSLRFLSLIRRVYEKTGKKVVVLVDEYDKPLIQTMEDGQSQDAIRNELKAFYGVLKTANPYLRFVLLTGVTKFSQVSVFSDLNQLRDISMLKDYAGICGISAAELTSVFDPEIRALAEGKGMTYDTALAEMQKRYNGYHFCEHSEGMFNPFSVLNTLVNRDFAYYWFQTGTPTFLINLLKQADFDPRDFSKGISISPRELNDYRLDGSNPIPVLYQSGYLTIKDYDKKFDEYLLGFPNEEVTYGFLEALLPHYLSPPRETQGFSVKRFIKDLEKGDVDAFMTRLKAFFAGIPYELNDQTERHYQVIFYLVFTLMGQFIQAEVRSAAGRADAIVITDDSVYAFEFKLSDADSEDRVEAALQQIDRKGYLIPYIADGRRLVKVGAAFDKTTRTLGGWKAVVCNAGNRG